jgi:hypothetical protein
MFVPHTAAPPSNPYRCCSTTNPCSLSLLLLLLLQVCLLTDVLLCDLGFSCMVAHLAPVAATFGANTSTACVVTLGTSVTSVTCVEDGSLVASKTLLQLGVADVGRALQGWLTWHRVWPEALQPGRSAYERSVMVDLLHQNCYCPPVRPWVNPSVGGGGGGGGAEDLGKGCLVMGTPQVICRILQAPKCFTLLHAMTPCSTPHPLSPPPPPPCCPRPLPPPGDC